MFSLLVMYQIEFVRNRFSDDDIQFILIKRLDKLIINEKRLSKDKVFECLRNIRDELDRYC